MAREKLQCTSCSYKFTPKGVKGIPDICPYCGTEGTVGRVDSAADILKKYGDD